MTSKTISLLLLLFIVLVSGCKSTKLLPPPPSRGKVIADKNPLNTEDSTNQKTTYYVCVKKNNGTYKEKKVKMKSGDSFPADFNFVKDCEDYSCDELEYTNETQTEVTFGKVVKCKD